MVKGVTLPTAIPGKSVQVAPMPIVKMILGTVVLLTVGFLSWKGAKWTTRKAEGAFELVKGKAKDAASIAEGL